MKFNQLIEYNIRNIFIEKSFLKYGGDYSHTIFYKIKIEHVSGSIV